MAKNRFHFSKASLSNLSLPVGVRQQFFYDEASRGLCVGVTQSGIKTFYVFRKFRGKPERVHIGRFPDTTIPQARKRAGQINSQFDAGLNANEIKRQKRGELMLNELFDEYLNRHVELYNRRPDVTKDNYRLYLSHLGGRRLSQITPLDVQTLQNRLARDIGTRTANKAITLLRAMFNRAIDWELFNGRNPTLGIRKFKELSRDRFLIPEELKRYLNALRTEPDITYRDLFLLLLLTGARKSNVLAMRWTDIDIDGLVWTIPQTKIGEPQVLPLSVQAVDILRARAIAIAIEPGAIVPLREKDATSGDGERLTKVRFTDAVSARRRTLHLESEFVFPGPGVRGHVMDPKKAWNRLLERAEIANFRIHDLRRTHGSYLAATGANQFVISHALGHRSIATTAIYARLDLDPIRNAATRANAFMLGKTAHSEYPIGN